MQTRKAQLQSRCYSGLGGGRAVPPTPRAHQPPQCPSAAAHLTEDAWGRVARPSALTSVLANDHTLYWRNLMPMVGLVRQTEVAVGAWVLRSEPQKAELEMSAGWVLSWRPSRNVISTPVWLVLAIRGQRHLPLLTVNRQPPSAPEGHWHPFPGPPTFPTSDGVSELLLFELLPPCSVPSPGKHLPFKGLHLWVPLHHTA